MAGGGIARDIRIQTLALTQVAAQHGIDQPGSARGVGGLGGLHGCVDHGILRCPFILEFVQRDRQQRAHQEIQGPHRGRQEAAQDRFVAIVPTYRSVA